MRGIVPYFARRVLLFALAVFFVTGFMGLPCTVYLTFADEVDEDTDEDDDEDDSEDDTEDDEDDSDDEDIPYTIKEVRGSLEVDPTEAADIEEVKDYLDMDLDATVSAVSDPSSVEEWHEIDADVVWDDSPQGYDASKKENYSFTWSGTIKQGDTIYYSDEDKEAEALSDISVTVTVTVTGDSSSVSDNETEEEEDQADTDTEVDTGSALVVWDKSKGNVEIVTEGLDSGLAEDILSYQVEAGGENSKAIEGALKDGKKITLAFSASSNDDKVSSDIKSRMKEESLNYDDYAEVGGFFDLTLTAKIEGDAKSYNISDTGDDIALSVKIPDNLQKSARLYNIVRYHEDEAEVLNDSFEELIDGGLSFETSYFSEYAIAYTDGDDELSENEDEEAEEEEAESIEEDDDDEYDVDYDEEDDTEDAPAGSDDVAGNSLVRAPRTGIAFTIGRIIYCIFVVSIISLCSYILYKDA